MTRGKKLKDLRGKKKQKEVLEELEKMGLCIDKNTLSNAENDKNLSNTTLEILAKYYNVSLDYLKREDVKNTTNANIKINKELGLSDKSIEIIKQIRKDEVDQNTWLDDGILNYFFEEFEDFPLFLASLSIVKNCEECMVNIYQFRLLERMKQNLYIGEKRKKIFNKYDLIMNELAIHVNLFVNPNILIELLNYVEELKKEFNKKTINKKFIDILLKKISKKSFENTNELYIISSTNTLYINNMFDRFISKVKGETIIKTRKLEEKIDNDFIPYLDKK